MSATNDGGPAFPRTLTINDGIDDFREISRNGMSLRDWFAGMALQGHLSGPEYGTQAAEKLASWSYECADAMLAAREGKGAQ